MTSLYTIVLHPEVQCLWLDPIWAVFSFELTNGINWTEINAGSGVSSVFAIAVWVQMFF